VTLLLILGVVGVVVLALSLIIDGFLEGVFDALGAGDWVSLPALAGFVSAFGFGGAAVLGLTDSGALATAGGVVAGAGFGWLAVRMSRALMRGGSGDVVSESTLVGSLGTVVTPIPANGFGEVLLAVSGHSAKYFARCDEPVPLGQSVAVVSAISSSAVFVTPLQV
jgi:membrane-bound ClpP family serine protease